MTSLSISFFVAKGFVDIVLYLLLFFSLSSFSEPDVVADVFVGLPDDLSFLGFSSNNFIDSTSELERDMSDD